MSPLGYQTNLMVARLHEGYMRPERGLEGDRKSSRSYFAVKPRPGSRLKNERKRPQGSEMVVFVHAEVMKDGGYTFGDFTKYGFLVQAMGHAEMISFAHGLFPCLRRGASHGRLRQRGLSLCGHLQAVESSRRSHAC